MALNWLKKRDEIKKRRKNCNNSSEPRNGRTKGLWIHKNFVSSSDDSIIFLLKFLKFEVLSYFDWVNPIDGIIKS